MKIDHTHAPLFGEEGAGIYLDCQATERPRPQAIEAVRQGMERYFGNPSALAHARGQAARRHLENFRRLAAGIVKAPAEALCFTSGATESNNIVLASEARRPGAHLVVSAIEHKSVLESARRAHEAGAKLSMLPVDRSGRVDLEALERLIAQGATLVCVMAANNEVGTIQPLGEIGGMCRRAGVRWHVDAAQAVGKLELDLGTLGVDYLSFTAHKFGGPQGIGALALSERVRSELRPLLVGGRQERGLRAGTTPIALCAGMAAASHCVASAMRPEVERMRRLRNDLLDGLRALGPFFSNSDVEHGLCNNLNGGFEGVSAMLLMRRMPQVQFSVASACTSGVGGSHVLAAMGHGRPRIESSFRLSVGWSTTRADVDGAVAAFASALRGLGGRRAGSVAPPRSAGPRAPGREVAAQPDEAPLEEAGSAG
ncbi:MAG: cysteine desulfurase [Comamonadaceae bacterium]|nr:MAG: cysteine desulfurase [Comamonadaceae bacterium]